jgi:RimJ/RimL family protein N-acetyltransferase
VDTPRLRIEPLAPTHANLLFEPLRDPRLYEFIPDDPPASLDALARRFEHLASGGRGDETWRNWIMFSQGDPVGTLQATIYPADRRALIAYVVFAFAWRRGFATEGVAWMLDQLRGEDVLVAEALIDTRNAASIGVVEKLGFRRVEIVDVDYRYALSLVVE